MERKRIEKLVVLLLVGILMPVSLFPLRINADTITASNINGISITLDEVTFIEYKQFIIDGVSTNVARNYYNYIAEIQLDKSYLGNININMQYTYQARNDTGMVTFNGTKLQKVFVNGDKAYMSFGFVANSNTDPLWYNSITYSLTNSDVIEYGLISDIQQIVTILEDNQDIIEDIYDELQNVVSNTSLANNYLETISKMRQWNIPFESFGFVHYLLSNNYQIFDYSTYNYYYFPIFKLQQNDLLMSVYIGNGRTFRFILGVNAYWTSESNIRSALNVPNTLTIENISTIDTVYSKTISGYGSYINIVKFDLSNKSGSGVSYKAYVNNAQYPNTLIVPIYANFINSNVSTDFALRFGLSNRLLDDLHLIASGTSQSSSASSSLDQATSQFSDDANDLVTIEESFNNSMNQSLQSVNPTFNMGSSFLTSANWVSQQFNRIVNNTPFASLITFGLTLGLGLLIIGKVRK